MCILFYVNGFCIHVFFLFTKLPSFIAAIVLVVVVAMVFFSASSILYATPEYMLLLSESIFLHGYQDYFYRYSYLLQGVDARPI